MRRTAITTVTSLVLYACLNGEGEYSVKMRNTGSREINNSRVSYGRFASDNGILIPRADKEELGVREPLPSSAIVEWTDADGGRHREVVNVSLPQGFKGVLVFEIDGANQVRVLMESPPRHVVP